MVRLTERALVGCPLWMVRGDGVPGVYHDQPVTTVGGHPHLVAVMFQAARQLVADVHRLGGVVHTHLGRVGTIEARHHPKAATAKKLIRIRLPGLGHVHPVSRIVLVLDLVRPRHHRPDGAYTDRLTHGLLQTPAVPQHGGFQRPIWHETACRLVKVHHGHVIGAHEDPCAGYLCRIILNGGESQPGAHDPGVTDDYRLVTHREALQPRQLTVVIGTHVVGR